MKGVLVALLVCVLSLPTAQPYPSYYGTCSTFVVSTTIETSMGASNNVANGGQLLASAGECSVSGIPAGGYVAGTSYTLTVTSSGTSRAVKIRAPAGTLSGGTSGTASCRNFDAKVASTTFGFVAPTAGTGAFTIQAICGGLGGFFLFDYDVTEDVSGTAAPTTIAAPTTTADGTTAPPQVAPDDPACTLTVDTTDYPFQYCTTLSLDSSFVLYFSTDGAVRKLGYKVTTATADGWAGIAFAANAGSMVGATAMLASHTETSVKAYTLYLRGATATPSAMAISNQDVHSSAGVLSAYFEVPTASTLDDIIYASGPWSGGSPQQHTVAARKVGTINFATGAVSSDSSEQRRREAHGWLMAIGWGVLLPAGTLLPRFFQHRDPLWFHLHRVLQVAGLVAASAGLYLGLDVATDTEQSHGAIGLVVMGIGYAVAVAGVLRPGKDSNFRPAWALFHFWAGRAAIILAVVNIWIGLRILDPNLAYKALYGVALGILTVAFIVLTAMGDRSKRTSQSTASPSSLTQNPAFKSWHGDQATPQYNPYDKADEVADDQ